MPYSYPDNVPEAVKSLPEGAQRLFVSVFNTTAGGGKGEEEARMAAWGAVKNQYEQSSDGEWTRKASEGLVRYVGAISLAEGSNLGRVQVFRTGTFHHPLYGKFTISDDILATMVKNFGTVRPKAPTELVVDYEHMSEMQGVQAPAAGWVKGLEAEPGALYAMVDWTDQAAGDIRSKRYRFISPVWRMNYKDKETDKGVGPTLMTMALTNRPFIEGMDPVVLSERIERANAGVMALSEKTLLLYTEASVDELSSAVRQAYYVQFPEEPDQQRTDYVEEIYDTFIIIERGSELLKLSYSRDDETGKVTFEGDKVPVTKSTEYTPIGALAGPDKPGSLPEAKAIPGAAADKAAKAGVGGDGAKDRQGEETKMEEEIRTLLGLGAEDDVLEAVKALKAKADEADAAKAEAEASKAETADAKAAKELAETSLAAKETANDVDSALREGKLLPRQVEWAKDLRAKDPATFAAFLATAEKTGPEIGVKGREGNDTDDVTLTASEAAAADKLGVSHEDVIAQKKRDAEAAAKA